MNDLTTKAELVDYAALEDGDTVSAVLARSELEEALAADGDALLWLELEAGGDPLSLTLELTPAEIEEILRLASGDEIAVALDADAIVDAFSDAEVVAHGMRHALAIAVAAAAVAAPTSLAASPQVAPAGKSPQVASAAERAQVSRPGVTSQVRPAARAQVSRPGARAQVEAQKRTQAKKTLAVKAASITVQRALRGR